MYHTVLVKQYKLFSGLEHSNCQDFGKTPNLTNNLPHHREDPMRILNSRFVRICIFSALVAIAPSLNAHATIYTYELNQGDLFRDPTFAMHLSQSTSTYRTDYIFQDNLSSLTLTLDTITDSMNVTGHISGEVLSRPQSGQHTLDTGAPLSSFVYRGDYEMDVDLHYDGINLVEDITGIKFFQTYYSGNTGSGTYSFSGSIAGSSFNQTVDVTSSAFSISQLLDNSIVFQSFLNSAYAFSFHEAETLGQTMFSPYDPYRDFVLNDHLSGVLSVTQREVPEPGTILLLGSGLLGGFSLRRKSVRA